MNEQLTSIQNNLQKGKSAIEELQDAQEDIEALREAKKQKIRELSNKQRDYEAILHSFQECSNTRDTLQNQLSILKSQLAAIEIRLASLTEENSSLNSTISIQGKKIEEQKANLARYGLVVNENKLLKRDLEQLRKNSNLQKLKRDYKSLEEKADEMNEAMQAIRSELEAERTTQSDLYQQIALLKKQIQTSEQTRDRLQAELRKAHIDCSDYCKALDIASSENISFELQISNLKQKCSQIEEDFRKSQQAAEQNKAGNITLSKRFSQFKKEAAAREHQQMQKIRRLEAEAQQVMEEPKRLEEKEQKISKLEGKVRKMKQRLESSKCAVCIDRTKTVVLLPCRHLFCERCVEVLQGRQENYCPVCRRDIENTLKIYL